MLGQDEIITMKPAKDLLEKLIENVTALKT
jgi:hypothetical protein